MGVPYKGCLATGSFDCKLTEEGHVMWRRHDLHTLAVSVNLASNLGLKLGLTFKIL